MNKVLLAAAFSMIAAGVAVPTLAQAAAAPVPCEKMLSDVKAAIGTAKVSDADKQKVADLQAKGLERCKADDDAGADDFFTQALKIMGK
jgi:hypothetical protein